MKQGKNKCTGPLCAGYLALALMASAAEQQLSNPPPSEFVDAESTTTVPIPTDEGRHLNLTLAFESTPSNAVQVAFGRDLNGSETLEPEASSPRGAVVQHSAKRCRVHGAAVVSDRTRGVLAT